MDSRNPTQGVGELCARLRVLRRAVRNGFAVLGEAQRLHPGGEGGGRASGEVGVVVGVREFFLFSVGGGGGGGGWPFLWAGFGGCKPF